MQRPRALGDPVVAGRDRAPVAERRKVLGGVEAERRRGRDRARAPVRSTRAGRLGGVLEHRHAERLDLANRREIAEQVHRDHGLRARRQRRTHRVRGDAERVGVDVAEDRRCAGVRDRLSRRVEGERRHDDLIAWPDAHRAQRDRQRVGAVGDADRVRRAEVGGELLLEGLHLRPEHVAPAVEHALDRRAQLAAQRLKRGGHVEQRDWHRRPADPIARELRAPRVAGRWER